MAEFHSDFDVATVQPAKAGLVSEAKPVLGSGGFRNPLSALAWRVWRQFGSRLLECCGLWVVAGGEGVPVCVSP